MRSSVTSYSGYMSPRVVSCIPSEVSEIGNSSPSKPEPRYFLDAKIPERRTVHHLVPKGDDAIDRELQKTVAHAGLHAIDFLRDDRGEPRTCEPVADAIDLAALGDGIVEQAEQHVKFRRRRCD